MIVERHQYVHAHARLLVAVNNTFLEVSWSEPDGAPCSWAALHNSVLAVITSRIYRLDLAGATE